MSKKRKKKEIKKAGYKPLTKAEKEAFLRGRAKIIKILRK